MGKIVVRFAPSPTGYLHLGGARTALYNWLFARQKKGQFRLRIEDTDFRRSTEESVRAIFDGLRWLGMNWDGEIVFQRQRLERYREIAQRLLEEGLAYRCACTAVELEAKREVALTKGLQPKYDRACRERAIPEDVPHALRFKSPLEGTTVFPDILRGEIEVANAEIDDLIIVRSDGTPTYNFCAVVDDHDMGVTHVIRGDDHLTNTPKQIKIYEALGWNPPQFAHLPLIAGLSKRKGSDSIQDYRDRGFLPQAVVNYIVRLGWGYGDQEVFTMEDLIEKFRLEDVGKSQGQVNEDKLLWLNGQHIRLLPPNEMVTMVEPRIVARGWEIPSPQWLHRAVATIQLRCNTIEEAVEKMSFYFVEKIDWDESVAKKYLTPEKKKILSKYADWISLLNWSTEKELEDGTRRFLAGENLKLKDIAHSIRVALSGNTEGPGLFELMDVLGKVKVIERLKRAAK